MDQIVQIFKALGDETRLKILIILSKRRICAKGIAKHLEISEAAVSQHLKTLKEAGIITGEKTGYYVLYALQEPMLLEIVKFVEQLKDNNSIGNCNFSIQMPKDCKVSCKAEGKKCCQK
jgi:ArsR family transcriptional regulator